MSEREPCPYALSQGGDCAGDCTICDYLTEWYDHKSIKNGEKS